MLLFTILVLEFILAHIFAYLTKKLIIAKFKIVLQKPLYHMIENTF